MPLKPPSSALRSYVVCGVLLGAFMTGCEGAQSALDPAGRGAERVATLFWWMVAVGLLIWTLVIGLAIYAIRVRPGAHSPRTANRLIIGGGAVLPTLVLSVLLGFGLAELPDQLAPAPEGSLRIAVSGEMWWWRVRYEPPGGPPVELANEIRLPVGQRTAFLLESADVIHSFWIPALGGKMDMIPGRQTRLTLEPTRTGTFNGVCAEFCGASHALMGFKVMVMEQADFEAWLALQQAPASPPAGALAAQGYQVFLASGCGACHAVRGTPADGRLGPDLTHVGSRLSLGAGILANAPDDFRRWLVHTDHLKPQVNMPAFGMLPADEIDALVAYLDGLE